MMKIHLINLNKYKDNIYNFLFYRDNLVYFYVLLYNMLLLLLVSIPIIVWFFSLVSAGSFFFLIGESVSATLTAVLKSARDTMVLGPIINFFGSMFEVVLDLVLRFFFKISDSLVFPIFTLVILIFTYFLKDRVIDTRYYKLFKFRLIDLLENNFTKYFLLFFVIFVLYLLVCLSICLVKEFVVFSSLFRDSANIPLLKYTFLWVFSDQVHNWFLPFLYSYFFLSFWTLVYYFFINVCRVGFIYIYVFVGIIIFLSIYLCVPMFFLSWEGGIFHYSGSYNWYVIYKLFRYFIIYPAVTSFFTGLLLSLFLYFFKK